MAYLPGIGECFGYIEGYRYWELDGLMRGIGAGSVVYWVPGVAMIGKKRRNETLWWPQFFDDPPPGVYAMRDELPHHPGENFVRAGDEREFIYGRVALWGTVVEHEKGYRAQYAYPLELIASTNKARDLEMLNFLYCGIGQPGWSERVRVALINCLAGDQTWTSENQKELTQSRPKSSLTTIKIGRSSQTLVWLDPNDVNESPPKQPKPPLAKFQQQVKAGKVKGYQRYWP